MVEFQGCAATAAAAALNDPSSCAPSHQINNNNRPPILSSSSSMPQHHHDNSSGAYQHSSSQQHISSKVGGGGGVVSVEDDEDRGGGGGGAGASSSSLNGGVRSGGGGVFGPRQALKRSRLTVEDDDQLSIMPAMDLSGPYDYGPPFFHHPYHQQQLYQQQHHHHLHHNPAVEATNNFGTFHSSSQQQQQQQAITPEQNGQHASASAHHVDSHFSGGDAHLMTDGVNNHYHGGGFLYPPQMPGQGPVPFNGLNMADVLVELERERKKNAELQGRLSSLEARLGSSSSDKHGGSAQNGAKKRKKQRRAERTAGEGESEENRRALSQADQLSAIKEEEEVVLHVTLPLEDPIQTDRDETGVTWMSREEVTPADLESLSKDIISERDDSVDTDDDDDDEDEDEDELEEHEDGEGSARKKRKGDGEHEVWKGIDIGGDGSKRGGLLDEGQRISVASGERHQVENGLDGGGEKKRRKSRKGRRKGKQGEQAFFSSKRGFGTELVPFRVGGGIMSSYKKAPKTAFCPKEVKRIMESGVLALKNAQSHTMRKIIVFGSLGIRHGCDDLYELDFSHFSVVQHGEPYKSPKEPGEHVLYDQAGVRTKMFYPNRQNPILCPVRILDEERAMRPAGPSCPTCLFLCIKYGGRTRNLPQNEYVRQRMGRNKLKSFGPLMCQMALLVHIRTGSFFFKALGITLLFMAGFPDDLVRKETKYRNLDLLQKYYRSDEDTKGEQLFHPYPAFFPPAMMVAPPSTQKAALPAKSTGKKGPPPLLSKPPLTPAVPRYLPPLSTRSPPAMPFRGMPPPFSPPPFSPSPSMSPGLPTSATSSGHPPATGQPPPPPHPHPPFGMYPPPYPPPGQGGFMPMPWAPVHSYPPPGPYPPPPFAYQPFSHSPQFLPPFYGPPFRFPPYGQQSGMKEEKKEVDESGESDSDSDSGSSGTGRKPGEKGNK